MDNIRRINRIFQEDGKTLVLALEHTVIFGPGKGLDKPGETIQKAIAGGVDAVMTSYGIARHFSRELSRRGLILRADGAATKLGPDVPAPVWFGVQEALRLGADALCISAFPGNHKEMATFNNLAETTREAHQWGLAVQAEMMPGGMGSGPEFRTKENIALAARAGLELGGDWVKIPYVDGFKDIVDTCYKPVVIMGLTKRASTEEFLTEMKAAMDSGAAGGTIGRNIFEAENPQAMAAALAAIIHQGVSVSEAMKIARG
ncbi:MAG: deoxyribose-phosphate aldolase [Anaerolineae bacterium]|nr:deoxyribose-phosphate aldolase [Anaerolineae bacterium]